MRTGVSAPRALVLICARTTCFAKTGLVGGGGASGGVSSHCHGTNSISNQRRDEIMVIVGSKACNKSRERKKDILPFVL